jgi:S1-C subfamily serine protease
MNMYDHPDINLKEVKQILDKFLKVLQNRAIRGFVLALIILLSIAFGVKIYFPQYFDSQIKSFLAPIEIRLEKLKNEELVKNQDLSKQADLYTSPISYEQAIIDSVKQASPSVVSIIISKNMPVYEQYFTDPFEGFASPFFDLGPGFDIQVPQYKQKGTEKKEVGGGSGFIVSEDGLIVTNKHVVIDKEAEYTVLTNDGQKYSAKVLALDPVQDLAIIKIQTNDVSKKFPAIKLGDFTGIQIGQGAIAIGNALGEFRNTVSVGIVSGLSRTISASGTSGFSEVLEDIIQTDAAINSGNSGGPLLNLKGEVIGINTAMAQGANSIGFAIPINRAKKDIEQVITTNKIFYPFLGVRYTLVNLEIKEKYKLSFDYGALVLAGEKGEVAITADSAAEKAGLKEKDLILEINGEKITQENSMAKIIQKYNPNDKISLKIIRDEKEIFIDVVLGERS